MNDPDQTVTYSPAPDNGSAEASWPADELPDRESRIGDEDLAVERSITFTSLGFLGTALRRSAWLWCATAVFGIIIGYALYVKYPPAYQATTSVLITNDPSQNPAEEMLTNLALAQSQAVAGQAVKQLGLNEGASSFLASYTVSDPSDQVLVITVSASSSTEAVNRASALASVFLQFRANYLKNQLQLEQTTLNQQVTQAAQQVASVNQAISNVSAEPVTAAQQARLDSLRTQLTAAENGVTTAQQGATAALATARTTNATEIKGSQLLDSATALRHSFKKGKAFYIGVSFFIGLILGMAIVIIRALVSDRLRRRDEIADVIGGPVKLSISAPGGWIRVPGRGRPFGRQGLDMRRLVTHLNSLVSPLSSTGQLGSRWLRGLAVVAVDNTREVAPAVVQLASWNAGQGKQVVIADLSDGSHAARLLGVTSPGVHSVHSDGADLTVIVPQRDDVTQAGPLPGAQGGPPSTDPDLAAACASADLLLSLATLDPAFGGEYLSTWATNAVAVVTAGKSSSVRLRAVGEMIRLPGLRLASVVLIGADKKDESLGLVFEQDDQPASALPI